MREAHGKEYPHGKVRSGARQRSCARQTPTKAHDKEIMTEKNLQAARQRLAARQWLWMVPCRCLCREGSLVARQRPLCRAFLSLPCANKYFICFSFYFISSNSYIYFVN
jgi:hypothetical protein